MTRRRVALAGAVLLAAGAAGGAALHLVRRPASTPYMRGYEVASRAGCFACHGPDGRGGVRDPESALGEAPPIAAAGGWALAYARDEDDVRAWIRFGRPARRAEAQADAAGPPERAGVLRMPAYDGVLSAREIDDLTAYVMASMALEARRPSGRAARGRRVARDLGCFGCHGPDGRAGLANPRSFKGYIPPWDGDDFEELVQGDEELRAWILDGEIPRFRRNPVAAWFIDRQVVKMPAYRDRVTEDDLASLVAFIRWVRGEPEPDGADPAAAASPRPVPSAEARGAWLYRRAGCVLCHGVEGRGGVPNPNAHVSRVPALDRYAEHLELSAAELRALAAQLDGSAGAEPPLFDEETADYLADELESLRERIVKGKKVVPVDPGAPRPLPMPGWSARLHADGGPLSRGDVDLLLAYLLRLSARGAER